MYVSSDRTCDLRCPCSPSSLNVDDMTPLWAVAIAWAVGTGLFILTLSKDLILDQAHFRTHYRSKLGQKKGFGRSDAAERIAEVSHRTTSPALMLLAGEKPVILQPSNGHSILSTCETI